MSALWTFQPTTHWEAFTVTTSDLSCNYHTYGSPLAWGRSPQPASLFSQGRTQLWDTELHCYCPGRSPGMKLLFKVAILVTSKQGDNGFTSLRPQLCLEPINGQTSQIWRLRRDDSQSRLEKLSTQPGLTGGRAHPWQRRQFNTLTHSWPTEPGHMHRGDLRVRPVEGETEANFKAVWTLNGLPSPHADSSVESGRRADLRYSSTTSD